MAVPEQHRQQNGQEGQPEAQKNDSDGAEEQQLAKAQRFFARLDTLVGPRGWSVVLSADHGIVSLPEVQTIPAARPWCANDGGRDPWERPCGALSRLDPDVIAQELQAAAVTAIGPGTWVRGVADPVRWLSGASSASVHQLRPIVDKRLALEIAPHYTNDRFTFAVGYQPQTVFGDEAPDPCGHSGLTYDYSDRLVQWDNGKSEKAWYMATESGAPPKSAEFLERYLSAFHGKPVEVVHVMAGVNRSNGGSYWIAGWRERPAEGGTR